MRDTDNDWNKLADKNPYHAVLTDNKLKSEVNENTRIEFIRTGANYISVLWWQQSGWVNGRKGEP